MPIDEVIAARGCAENERGIPEPLDGSLQLTSVIKVQNSDAGIVSGRDADVGVREFRGKRYRGFKATAFLPAFDRGNFVVYGKRVKAKLIKVLGGGLKCTGCGGGLGDGPGILDQLDVNFFLRWPENPGGVNAKRENGPFQAVLPLFTSPPLYHGGTSLNNYILRMRGLKLPNQVLRICCGPVAAIGFNIY